MGREPDLSEVHGLKIFLYRRNGHNYSVYVDLYIVNENVTNVDNFQIFGPTGGGGVGSEPGPLDVPSPGTPSENEQYDLYFDDVKYLASRSATFSLKPPHYILFNVSSCSGKYCMIKRRSSASHSISCAHQHLL